MHRNVKFIKNLLIDGMNMERISSIVIFTASNPNSVQPIDTKTNDANGNVVFKTISYTQADAGKTFTYTIEER